MKGVSSEMSPTEAATGPKETTRMASNRLRRCHVNFSTGGDKKTSQTEHPRGHRSVVLRHGNNGSHENH